MDEVIDLVLEITRPFIDADTQAGHEIQRAADEGRSVVPKNKGD